MTATENERLYGCGNNYHGILETKNSRNVSHLARINKEVFKVDSKTKETKEKETALEVRNLKDIMKSQNN